MRQCISLIYQLIIWSKMYLCIMELQVQILLNMIVPSPTYRGASCSFQVSNLISIRSEISIQCMCHPYFMNAVLGYVSAWLDVQWINLLSSRCMLLLTMIGMQVSQEDARKLFLCRSLFAVHFYLNKKQSNFLNATVSRINLTPLRGM